MYNLLIFNTTSIKLKTYPFPDTESAISYAQTIITVLSQAN